MRAINHALTGAVIGLVSGEPLLALPAAVVSHFVCDMIPHHGGGSLRSRWFAGALVIDGALCVGLVALLAITQPAHWLLAAVCAFAAAAPDFIWVDKYVAAVRGLPYHAGRFADFSKRIQWSETPAGSIVEVVWFVVFGLSVRALL